MHPSDWLRLRPSETAFGSLPTFFCLVLRRPKVEGDVRGDSGVAKRFEPDREVWGVELPTGMNWVCGTREVSGSLGAIRVGDV